MLLYPQLISGAVAQFPISRSYLISNLTNVQEDGSRYRWTSVDPAWMTWMLTYRGLSAEESKALSSFFQSTRGRLQTFTYLDPLGNLLAWSEDLSQAVWEESPLASVTGMDSELGKAWQVSGSGFKVTQLLACPATALLCFSLFARADNPTSFTIALSDASGRAESTFALGTRWSQFFVTQSGSGDSVGKTVEIRCGDGAQMQIARLSVAPQPAPGVYCRTGQLSGLLLKTRFDQDILALTAAGLNDFGCEIRLTSRLS